VFFKTAAIAVGSEDENGIDLALCTVWQLVFQPKFPQRTSSLRLEAVGNRLLVRFRG